MRTVIVRVWVVAAGAAAVRARVVDDRAACPGSRGTARRTRTRPGCGWSRRRPGRPGRCAARCPGLAPLPWQVAQAPGLVQPQRHGHPVHGLARSRASTSVSTSWPRAGPAAGAARRGRRRRRRTCRRTGRRGRRRRAGGRRRRPAAEQVAEVERLRRPAAGAAAGQPPRAGTPPAPNSDRASSYSPRRLVVGEHVVGLGDLLEPRLGLGVARVLVRVQVAGELAVRLLDVRRGGVLGDAQRGVVVLLEKSLVLTGRLLSCSADGSVRRPASSAGGSSAGRRRRRGSGLGDRDHRRPQQPLAQPVALPQHRRRRSARSRPATCRGRPPRAASGRTGRPASPNGLQPELRRASPSSCRPPRLNAPVRSPWSRARSMSSSTGSSAAQHRAGRPGSTTSSRSRSTRLR